MPARPHRLRRFSPVGAFPFHSTRARVGELIAGHRLGVAVALVALVAAGASSAGLWVKGWPNGRLTGDEPHYLVTAISLAEDGDLDIADEIAEERYLPFHELELVPQADPLPGGRLVSPHDPLFPALLAAPAAAGGWVAAKLVLALLAGALAGVLLWTAVRRLSVPLGSAVVVTAAFSVSAPLAVYGTLVYPEIPAALAVAVGVSALTGPLARRGLIVLAATVVALPWLGTKYVPVAAALALVALWRLARRREWARAGSLVFLLVAAAGAFLVAHQLWYGGWTPYAGRGFADGEFGVVGSSHYDILARGRRLIALLIDRDYGVGAWQPAWLLVVPALAAMLVRRPARWEVIALPLAAGWLTASFVARTMHGWWWPGRQVVVVLPLAVLAVAWWVGPSRLRLSAVGLAGALGALTYAWVVVEGLRGDLTWVVGFIETRGPWYRAWRLALPDYRDATWTTWLLHWAWVGIGLGLVAVWLVDWAAARRRLRPRPASPLERLA